MAGEDEPRVEKRLHEAAVVATSEYLIQLIRNQNWCTARIVGQALEALVNVGSPNTAVGIQRMARERIAREE